MTVAWRAPQNRVTRYLIRGTGVPGFAKSPVRGRVDAPWPFKVAITSSLSPDKVRALWVKHVVQADPDTLPALVRNTRFDLDDIDNTVVMIPLRVYIKFIHAYYELARRDGRA